MNNATVIKLKAEVENTSLPVLTKGGLMPYYVGIYVNRLDEQGYTLSEGQMSAVTSFFSSLEESGAADYVKYYWPFIGNSDNKNAAKVPLIGDKLIDFSSSFADIAYTSDDEIVGLTSFPAVTSVTAGDLQGDGGKNCVIGASFIKKDTSSISDIFLSVLNAGNVTQLRFYQTSIGLTIFSKNIISPNSDNLFRTSLIPETYSDPGNSYIVLGLGEGSKYCRYAKHNDSNVFAASGTTSTYYITSELSETDKAKTIKEVSYTYLDALTGLVVFKRVPPVAVLNTFMAAMKTMNITLGKESV